VNRSQADGNVAPRQHPCCNISSVQRGMIIGVQFHPLQEDDDPQVSIKIIQ